MLLSSLILYLTNERLTLCLVRRTEKLSWGTHHVKLLHRAIENPYWILSRTQTDMWRVFSAQKCAERDKFSPRNFFSIDKSIAGNYDKALSSIEYLTERLVNYNMLLLERIVKELALPQDLLRLCIDLAVTPSNFMKYQFQNHLSKYQMSKYTNVTLTLSLEFYLDCNTQLYDHSTLNFSTCRFLE